MPSEYYGNILIKKSQDTITPREWTELEEEWVWNLKQQGFSDKDISISCNRDKGTVSMKMNRLRQKHNEYNLDHIDEKYKANMEFLEYLKPKSLLDVYCGVNSFYADKNIKLLITNDRNKEVESDYHMDALQFVCKMYGEGKKFDVVDLDPYGTSINSFEIAVQLAKKGIVVTLGELSCKRYKRLDNICRNYDIYSIEDLTTDNLIKNLQRKALKYKKDLVVFKIMEWNGISRVWFLIKPINIMTCDIINKVKSLKVTK